jgi:hypothetical protein
MGVETDTLKTKIGDGVTAWSALSYATEPGGTDDFVYQADCSTITNGICVDTDDGAAYYWDGTTVTAVGSGGTVDLTAPGPIGSVTPDTGAFTTLTAVSYEVSAPASGETGEIALPENPDNGTDLVTLKAPASVLGDVVFTLPYEDGLSGYGLITNGSGVLSWANFQAGDGDLDDLADGSLTGSKVSAASSTAVGVVELATDAETSTGTSTTLAVTPDGLAGSIYGQKELFWTVTAAATNTAVADGTDARVVPASMNGMNLVDLTCAVANLNSAASGATTVVIRRVRAGTAANMTSTGVTINYNEYTASDETVDTASDDLATGDSLYLDVDAITTDPHKGLSCTATFKTP